MLGVSSTLTREESDHRYISEQYMNYFSIVWSLWGSLPKQSVEGLYLKWRSIWYLYGDRWRLSVVLINLILKPGPKPNWASKKILKFGIKKISEPHIMVYLDSLVIFLSWYEIESTILIYAHAHDLLGC